MLLGELGSKACEEGSVGMWRRTQACFGLLLTAPLSMQFSYRHMLISSDAKPRKLLRSRQTGQIPGWYSTWTSSALIRRTCARFGGIVLLLPYVLIDTVLVNSFDCLLACFHTIVLMGCYRGLMLLATRCTGFLSRWAAAVVNVFHTR